MQMSFPETVSDSLCRNDLVMQTDCCSSTLIEDSVNTNQSKFGVSISNSIAPPLVQKFTHVNNFLTICHKSLAQAESNEVQKS